MFSKELNGKCEIMKSKLFLVTLVFHFFSISLFADACFDLWQLPSQTPSQMNSYVIQTENDSVIVIDGGNTGDASYLRGFLAALGNKVSHWFITHPHSDHANAFIEIIQSPADLKIENILGSMPEEEWIEKYEPTELYTIKDLNKALKESNRKMYELVPGQLIEIDGIKIEILSTVNPEIIYNPINNSSLVMKITDDCKSVLFLGDLGVQGGNKLLEGPLSNKLKSDYVQMAHHGQNGVNKEFYEKVGADYALWPTPLWLWNNDNGGGKNSGPWKTLEVRQWMKELGVKENYVSAFGIVKISSK
jgi:beta-lactamase superfamily II metal-dependent hydrolase